MLTKKEAEKLFKPYLEDDCISCPAKKDELCDTPAVWIHASRFIKLRHKEPVNLR